MDSVTVLPVTLGSDFCPFAFKSKAIFFDLLWSKPLARRSVTIHSVTMEDGQSYYADAWTMGGESYIWLLLELEECLVWRY